MAITEKSIKILWANAAGRCAFPSCPERLCTDSSGNSAPHTIGEMAHIRGERPGSNRYDESQTQLERNAYENLILLCPTHHTLIDKRENESRFSVDCLKAMKEAHERRVSGRLNELQFRDKHEVAAHLYPLLQENHAVFISFGPHSEIARRNPESNAHAVWLIERLATIIPNNRRMLATIEANSGLFSREEQVILARFRVHARSYERWVYDEIAYDGVVSFPAEFETMISELARARA